MFLAVGNESSKKSRFAPPKYLTRNKSFNVESERQRRLNKLKSKIGYTVRKS